MAGQRRRQQAITVGKERRDAVVRAKRMRRADDSDEGMLDDEQVSERALAEDTVKAVEDLKSAFSVKYLLRFSHFHSQFLRLSLFYKKN